MSDDEDAVQCGANSSTAALNNLANVDQRRRARRFLYSRRLVSYERGRPIIRAS